MSEPRQAGELVERLIAMRDDIARGTGPMVLDRDLLAASANYIEAAQRRIEELERGLKHLRLSLDRRGTSESVVIQAADDHLRNLIDAALKGELAAYFSEKPVADRSQEAD